MNKVCYRPAGRLVPIFSTRDGLGDTELTVEIARHAASFGETVLLLDVQDGALMDAAGVIYNKTLADVIMGTANLHDARYVTSNEHFTVAAAGDIALDDILGCLAALSLSYDWVFVSLPSGCTPAHTKLAAACDTSVMLYDSQGDQFMRAFWMMDAVRARAPKFDPLILSAGRRDGAVESALMLCDTVREYLGAPPPYAGCIHDERVEIRLLTQMRAAVQRSAVA